MICNIIHKLRYMAQNLTTHENSYCFILVFLPFWFIRPYMLYIYIFHDIPNYFDFNLCPYNNVHDRSWFMICNIIHKLRYTAQNITSHEKIYCFLLIFFFSFLYVHLIFVCQQSMSDFVLVTSLMICFYSLCATLILMSKAFWHLYIQNHVLNITLGKQFVNLSLTIYSNANTNSLCQYHGYYSVHP